MCKSQTQEESVWWCLDVFFVLLGLGEGEGLDHQQQVHYQPCVEGVEKASERLSKAILLSPFIEGSSSCSLFMSFTVCTRKNLHSCEGKLQELVLPLPTFLTATLWVGRCTILGSSREINDLSLDPGKRAGKQRKPFPLRLFFVSTQHFRYRTFSKTFFAPEKTFLTFKTVLIVKIA